MTVNRSPGIQPSEVAEAMMLDPSTVTRLVEKLEGKGLVSRKTEGRTTLIHPTESGSALMPDLLTAWSKVAERYSAVLGRKNAAALTEQIYEAAVRLEGM